MKKTIRIFMLAMLVVSVMFAFATMANATETLSSIPAEGSSDGIDGVVDEITWKFDSATGTLKISNVSVWEGPKVQGTGATLTIAFGAYDMSAVKEVHIVNASCIQGSVRYNVFENLEKVVFGPDTTGLQIRTNCFTGCSNLKEIDFGTVTGSQIQVGAFTGTALTKVTIPSGFGTVAAGAFDEGVVIETKRDSACWNALVASGYTPVATTIPAVGQWPAADGSTFTWTFEASTGALEITYASTWEGPKKTDIKDAFGGYFDDVKSLSLKNASCIQADADLGNFKKLETVTLCGTLIQIRDNAFNGCTSLKTVNILSSTPKLGKYAFANTAITGITLPAATSLYNSADPATIFEGCAEVIVSTTYDSACWKMFDGVANVTPDDPNYDPNATSGPMACGINTWEVSKGVLKITGTGTDLVYEAGEIKWDSTIGEGGAFANAEAHPWSNLYKEITSVVVEAPLAALSTYDFAWLTNLESVVLPAECVGLNGCDIFMGAEKLTSVKTTGVEVDDGIIDLRNFTSIQNDAFESAFIEVTPEVWLGKSATCGNNKFARNSTNGAKFVVFPGTTAEADVYKMITARTNNVTTGEITLNYYTTKQDPVLGAEIEALTTVTTATTSNNVPTVGTFDIATGTLTVSAASGAWDTLISNTSYPEIGNMYKTWKYAIKKIVIDSAAKYSAQTTQMTGLPELEEVVMKPGRFQGWAISFGNNPKLVKFSDGETRTGTLDISHFSETYNACHASAIKADMFSNLTSIERVVLPATAKFAFNADKNGIAAGQAIISIEENAFSGLTSLKEVVIPEGSYLGATVVTNNVENTTATGTIAAGAFAGCTGDIIIVIEDSTKKAADYGFTDLAAIFPNAASVNVIGGASDSDVDPDVITSAIGWTGWGVRTSVKNGIRAIFSYNPTAAIAANTDWTLEEAGVVMSALKNSSAAKNLAYSNGTVSAATGAIVKPVFDMVDGQLTKTGNTIVSNKAELGTAEHYFAGAIINYSKNYTDDVFFAGYEVWTNKTSDKAVIKYVNQPVDHSIYSLTLEYYKTGLLDSKVSVGEDKKEDIAFDVLVKGGAVTLDKATYFADDTKFTDDFTVVNVPVLDMKINKTNKKVTYKESGIYATMVKDSENADSYVLIYRAEEGKSDLTITANDWNRESQFTVNWHHSGSYKYTEDGVTKYYDCDTAANEEAGTVARVTPFFSKGFYTNVKYIVINSGIHSASGYAFRGTGVETLVYNADFDKCSSSYMLNGATALSTMFKAGTKMPEEGLIDISGMTNLQLNEIFLNNTAVKAIKLPESAKFNATCSFNGFAAGATNLTTVWCGDDSNRREGVINLANLDIAGFTTLGGNKPGAGKGGAFSGVAATELWLPATVTALYETDEFKGSKIAVIGQVGEGSDEFKTALQGAIDVTLTNYWVGAVDNWTTDLFAVTQSVSEGWSGYTVL